MTEFTLPDSIWEKVQVQIQIIQLAQQQIELARRLVEDQAKQATWEYLGMAVPDNVVLSVNLRGVVRFLKEGKPVDLEPEPKS